MSRFTLPVLSSSIDRISASQAVAQISEWANARQSRYVCICNAHSTVEADRNADFRRVVEQADMATPDGAPVAWLMRRLGASEQQRVSGPDLMLDYCAHAQSHCESIFLYGSTPETLAKLQRRLMQRWPELHIAGAISPPFRALGTEEDAADVAAINASGAGTVWVSLGCPKQEQWMAAHRGRVHAVMVGVGAAFDFHAGTTARAPAWLRDNGLEWVHRLASEPRRLWRRYLFTNTWFAVAAFRQLLSKKP